MLDSIDKFAVRLRMTLTQPINTSAVIIMALYTLLWGLFIMLPVVSFDSLRFAVLVSIMPEFFWGALAFSVGYVMLLGVLKHSFKSLSRGAFVGFIHWLIIAVCYLLGDWTSTGWITGVTVATYCGFIYLNLKQNKDEFPFTAAKLSVDRNVF